MGMGRATLTRAPIQELYDPTFESVANLDDLQRSWETLKNVVSYLPLCSDLKLSPRNNTVLDAVYLTRHEGQLESYLYSRLESLICHTQHKTIALKCLLRFTVCSIWMLN